MSEPIIHECDNPACSGMVDTSRWYAAELHNDGTVSRFCSVACHDAVFPTPPNAITLSVDQQGASWGHIYDRKRDGDGD